MEITEVHYHSSRENADDDYQDLEVVQEVAPAHEIGAGRKFIRFALMEQRWRSRKEAASYLRWAAKEIESLPK